jgi:hypothetical protein
MRKLFSGLTVLVGALATAFSVLLGFAGIVGGYYSKPFDGALGQVAGAFTIAMWRDWSVAILFWPGIALILFGFMLWPKRRKR